MENKEITLWDLCLRFFGWIGSCLKSFGVLLGKSLQLCYRHRAVSIPLGLAVIALFIFLARPGNKWYKVEGVLLLNGSRTELAREVLKPVEQAFDPRVSNVQNYGQLLGVSNDVMKEHQKFFTHYVIDCMNDTTADYIDYKNSSSMTDTMHMRMTDRIAVTFLTHDLEVALPFADSVLAYLNRDPRMRSTFEAYRADLQRESDFCRDQIELLDSLTAEFYFHQGIFEQNAQFTGNPNNLLIGRREIKLFYNEVLDLIGHKKVVDYKLSLCTAPAVVQGGFTINYRAVNGLLRFGIYGLLLGYLLAVLVCALIEFWNPLFAWLGKQ